MRGLRAQPGEDDLVAHQWELAPAARHDDDVERRTVGKRDGRQEREPGVGAHRLGVLPHQVHGGAGDPVQHLERAGQVELGQAGKQQHPEVHAGIVALFRCWQP
ncbi:MAG: hypothetical protein WKG01_08130 [Kofleriaceae bacterium]